VVLDVLGVRLGGGTVGGFHLLFGREAVEDFEQKRGEGRPLLLLGEHVQDQGVGDPVGALKKGATLVLWRRERGGG
jgi:hypothetical protein